MKFKKTIYYLSIFGLVILSFTFYSSNYYPLLNSDDALNILMAHYYKLPHNIYCWGQDRGGTLIPLISQIFIKVLNFSALTSVSLSNYLILIIGFIGFSSLFKTTYSKVIFGIIWFLPFQRFIDILRFPIGVEYSLIAFSIYLLNKLENKNLFNSFKNTTLSVSVILILTLSVWVSDLALVTIGVLLIILFIFDLLKEKKIVIKSSIWIYVISGFIFCYLLISTAKSFADVKAEGYMTINNFEAIKKALQILKLRYVEVLTFQTKEILISIYSYCVLIFLIIFSAYIAKKRLYLHLISNKWVAFFLCDFIVILITLLLSSWVLANEMGRWYFVASYISLSMVILLAIENLPGNKIIKNFKYALLLIVIIGAISPIYTMRYGPRKTLRPMVDIVGEFKQLGKIGVIAEFWNSFITSCPDPEMIKAIPHDQCSIRNPMLIDMVFKRDKLYVIKDMWMKEFPDTLEQFGYILIKNGDQFTLGGCEVCKYNKIKLHKRFSLSDLIHNESNSVYDNFLKKNVLFLSNTMDTCKNQYCITGPGIPIGIGEFTAKFYIKSTNFKNDKSIVLLKVTADSGATELADTLISQNKILDNKYISNNLSFKTTKRYKDIEFRVYYYGNADFYFDHIELVEK